MIAIHLCPARVECATLLEIGMHARLFCGDAACRVKLQEAIQQPQSVLLEARH
jgi:hypothetical protein